MSDKLRRLDDQYFKWLYKNVCSIRERSASKRYWALLTHLFLKEFVWVIPNDDNRVEDGRNLRSEFLRTRRKDSVDLEAEFMRLGCSMLEMLLGISRRLSFDTEIEARDWFWELIENLDLIHYNDNAPIPTEEIDAILDRVIWRIYKPNGFGGLFPLAKAAEDQRAIELWYQQSAYLLEKQRYTA